MPVGSEVRSSRVLTLDESDSPARARLVLLRGFQLMQGETPVALPMGSRRVLAFLCLYDRPVQRVFVAGTLWPETPEDRAQANLRSALWRLRRSGIGLVETSPFELSTPRSLSVDVRDATELARRLIDAAHTRTPVMAQDVAQARALLTNDLLADWYDDWIALERERFRQIRLHALEALSASLARAKWYAEAAEAALAAIAGEPLRESAQRMLISIHLAEGNQGEAVRQYELYRSLLRRELGAEPSAQMQVLYAEVRSTAAESRR